MRRTVEAQTAGESPAIRTRRFRLVPPEARSDRWDSVQHRTTSSAGTRRRPAPEGARLVLIEIAQPALARGVVWATKVVGYSSQRSRGAAGLLGPPGPRRRGNAASAAGLVLHKGGPTAKRRSEMAYDEGLAQRVRELLEDQPALEERKMFGGLAFMLQGNMACGALGDALIVRVGPEAHDEVMALPGAGAFDFTGKAMRGIVKVEAGVCEEDDELAAWVERGKAFALSLPPK